MFYDTSPPLPSTRRRTSWSKGGWTCEEATRQVDDRRKRVTSELGSSVRDDQAWGVRLAYLADTASDHGAALRGGAGVSNGRGDVLATLDDGPVRVAAVSCAKDSAIRLPIRADVLERLLKRFRRAQDAADEAIGKEKETKSITVVQQEPLVQKAGRIPKKMKRTQTSEEHTARPAHFLSHVYSMLLRYDDLSGEAGQHGAIPPQVFDVLSCVEINRCVGCIDGEHAVNFDFRTGPQEVGLRARVLRDAVQRHSGLVRLAVPGHGRRVWLRGQLFRLRARRLPVWKSTSESSS